MEKRWWKESVVYQIYPRSFMDSNGDGIGDIQGVISKLDYLKNLGIDVIWICPIYQSPNADNGYDISDYKGIMEEFGSMEDFDQLLNEVHKRDMKLIMDLVINHTSDEHRWFIESQKSKDNPFRDYYIWRPGKNGKEPNNWESIFGGSAWEYDEKTDEYYMHLFATKQPDLNWENPDVRNDIYSMINWWLDKGIDGFRVDAISHIKKIAGLPDLPNPDKKTYVPSFEGHMNREGIDDFLTELKEKTFDHHDIMTVGEANGVHIKDAEKWVSEKNGYFDMIFQFEHINLWQKDKDTGFDLVQFKKILSRWQKGLEGRGWNALYLENHDQTRSVSAFGNDHTYHSQSAKALAVCYFLMHGTPYIYQGQEIGMTNVQFPSIEDYNDVGMLNFYHDGMESGKSHEELMEVIWTRGRDNSRTPMQWDSSVDAGFTSGKPWMHVNPNHTEINVEKQSGDPESILSFYKELIRIRKTYDVFVYGKYDLLLEDDPQIYAYTRTYQNEKAIIVTNLSDQKAEFSFEGRNKKTERNLIIANYPSNDHGEDKILLHPYEARVYLVK
ncbi:alpha-glucosidase [Alkalihalobacillus sp. AL-G]|uniref:glycoside hydrolase family 13 protein n=1 Tax=Alkalihalobacillus sp. AL-G TaxID=2926399 RepID=UPI00272C12D6|nr:alpha-glucosidase [Alkalihalobacillus sp. AL-G]WLD94776.1 alpha-glucosidase [Alkalihalobacillus sp. AL-G]